MPVKPQPTAAGPSLEESPGSPDPWECLCLRVYQAEESRVNVTAIAGSVSTSLSPPQRSPPLIPRQGAGG